MATISRTATTREVDYPTSDGKPMGETDLHRQDMVDVIDTLADRFAPEADVYVTGNLLLFYEEGNRRKHISPDVFVVRGVPKLPPRDYYLLWKEGRSPDAVIEITSKTTRREDQNKKLAIYRDILKVREYFQFDPTEDYLKPPLQGFRLVEGEYVRIEPVGGPAAERGAGIAPGAGWPRAAAVRPGPGHSAADPTRAARRRAAGGRGGTSGAEEARARAEEARARAEEARRGPRRHEATGRGAAGAGRRGESAGRAGESAGRGREEVAAGGRGRARAAPGGERGTQA